MTINHIQYIQSTTCWKITTAVCVAPWDRSRTMATSLHLAVLRHDQHGRTVLRRTNDHLAEPCFHGRLPVDLPSSSVKTQNVTLSRSMYLLYIFYLLHVVLFFVCTVAVFFFFCDLYCVFLCIFFSFTAICVHCVFYCLLPSGVLNK